MVRDFHWCCVLWWRVRSCSGGTSPHREEQDLFWVNKDPAFSPPTSRGEGPAPSGKDCQGKELEQDLATDGLQVATIYATVSIAEWIPPSGEASAIVKDVRSTVNHFEDWEIKWVSKQREELDGSFCCSAWDELISGGFYPCTWGRRDG